MDKNGHWVRRYVLNRYVFATFVFMSIAPVFQTIHLMTAGSIVGLLYQVLFAPYWLISYSIPTEIVAELYLATGVDIDIWVFHALFATVLTFLIRKVAANLEFDGSARLSP